MGRSNVMGGEASGRGFAGAAAALALYACYCCAHADEHGHGLSQCTGQIHGANSRAYQHP